MIVQSGTITMDIDIDRLSADGSLAAKVQQLRFAIAVDPFFNILVFNGELRGPEEGSMALIPQYSSALPSLGVPTSHLVVEKLPANESADSCSNLQPTDDNPAPGSRELGRYARLARLLARLES